MLIIKSVTKVQGGEGEILAIHAIPESRRYLVKDHKLKNRGHFEYFNLAHLWAESLSDLYRKPVYLFNTDKVPYRLVMIVMPRKVS